MDKLLFNLRHSPPRLILLRLSGALLYALGLFNLLSALLLARQAGVNTDILSAFQGLLFCWAGGGLMRRQGSGRILALGLSGFHLLWMLGTAIAGLWSGTFSLTYMVWGRTLFQVSQPAWFFTALALLALPAVFGLVFLLQRQTQALFIQAETSRTR